VRQVAPQGEARAPGQDAREAGREVVLDAGRAGGSLGVGADAGAAQPDSGASRAKDGSTDAAHPPRASGQPAEFDDELALPLARDDNPDPDVIEFDLEARVADLEFIAGKSTPAWTYNGTVPGPLLRAQLGQTVIVHFKNSLPEGSSIHWHGLRVSNDVDGVPGVTQPLIEPGAEHTYEFTLRDAGTYWYHPHYDTVQQLGKGLYGAIVVTDPADPELGEELVLMLSDMSLDEEGQFQSDELGGDFSRLFGREGGVLLVNGRVNPVLRARSGLRQRWRVLNAARSRYMGLAFEGQAFTRLGGDGGLAQRPSEVVGPPILVPGARADLSVAPIGTPGTETQVQWVATDRGFGSTFNRPNEDLFKVRFSEEPTAVTAPLPPLEREIPAPATSGAQEIDLELTVDTPEMRLILGINHAMGDAVPPIIAALGDTQVWNLSNNSDFAHPFHLHGFFFQRVDDAGVPTEPREWLDTIDVPVAQSLRIAVHFDERPGMWMYHCHILDHAEGGMMGMVHLE
jgi:FtsP/CotA-like multicopper oxidase with cupredoxin domain